MEENYFLQQCITYSGLGYDITVSHIFGKECLRMIKRLSRHKDEPVHTAQICNHSKLNNKEYLNGLISFLFADIAKQEESQEYKEKMF